VDAGFNFEVKKQITDEQGYATAIKGIGKQINNLQGQQHTSYQISEQDQKKYGKFSFLYGFQFEGIYELKMFKNIE